MRRRTPAADGGELLELEKGWELEVAEPIEETSRARRLGLRLCRQT